MVIYENFDIKPFNTFGINAKVRYLVTISKPEDLTALSHFLNDKKLAFFILGGGSNVLFSKDFEGIVIKNELKGIQQVAETETTVTLKINAGEIWTDLVDFCINKGWGGIENLIAIPGTMGGASVQNIGAYGAEISHVIQSVTTYHLKTGAIQEFSKEDCQYGYRKSIFKDLKNKDLLIVTTSITLNKKPTINTEYGAVKTELQKRNIDQPNLLDIRNIIADIRKEKLPDVHQLGNAGSFFKNPEVSIETANQLQQKYPNMPIYQTDTKNIKLAAGWLIDQCQLRGYRVGDAGVHEKQALVLVNHGNATASEILKLVDKVQSTVKQKFGIDLFPEVIIV